MEIPLIYKIKKIQIIFSNTVLQNLTYAEKMLWRKTFVWQNVLNFRLVNELEMFLFFLGSCFEKYSMALPTELKLCVSEI